MKEELPKEKKDSTLQKKEILLFPKLPWIQETKTLELTEEIEGLKEFLQNFPRLNEYNEKTILYYFSGEKIKNNDIMIKNGIKFFSKLNELAKNVELIISSEDMIITFGKIFIALFLGERC